MKAACVLNAGRNIAKIGYELGQFKSNLFHVARDARRAARRRWCAAEDLLEGATFAVKREPLKSMGLTFGVALGIGMLAGWLATRR